MATIKSRQDLIKAYIEFFKSKKHKEIPNSSLIPQNDPSTLFNSAGMQPIIPYLLGKEHPLGSRLTNVQKCIRTVDIEVVGDTTHHTFMEMLGNWSLGDYWKQEAIEFSLELFTKVLKLPIERIGVTCFAGNKNAPKDLEASGIWESLGIPKERIAFLKDNWWELPGPGPCGPDTEVFFWKPNSKKPPKIFDPEDENWVEIWNDVLMQYVKDESGNYKEAEQKNIDNGRGLERVLSVIQGYDDNYLTSIWQPIIKTIEKLSGKSYKDNEKKIRIIADHIKASVFIIADGIVPNNTGQGYVLRRIIRKAIRHARDLDLNDFTPKIAESIFPIYPDYPELKENKSLILSELKREESKFEKTLSSGLSKFKKLTENSSVLSGKSAFLLFQSYGFPIEITEELCKENKVKLSIPEFQKELEKHQALSRSSSKGMFKSGLADSSNSTLRLHTATHLLNEALREVLGSQVKQKGSNITPERLRFDFNFDRKLTEEEIKKVENLVNKKISQNLEIFSEDLPLNEALKSGAQGEFGAKYPSKVSVYTILDPKDPKGFFSKEICTGPHVSNTKEIGKFKIIKEESSSAGVRRIKAVVE